MEVPRILLLGKNGQLGWELQRSLAPLGQLVVWGRDDPGGDLAQPQALAAAVRALRPSIIVNAAAYTAVDKAESEAALAQAINAEAPGVLAQEAARLGAWLVHYSTDYVFDGSGSRPWQEGDATGPQNIYGRSKLEGEQRIQAACNQHLILRTSWVYAARGGNFAKTMLRLAQERERLTVIDDQWGAPTGADLLADLTAHALRQALQSPRLAGLYHAAAAGETTWHRYARYVLDQARQLQPSTAWKVRDIAAVPTNAFPTPAARPANSRLDTQRFQSTFGLTLPPWEQGVARMLAEIL